MTQKHGKFVWYELMTTDRDAASAFYGTVTGWEASESAMDGENYTVFEVPGYSRAIGGMMDIPPELAAQGVPPNWTGYVYVEDVDITAADFVINGGSVRRQPADIPDVGRFAVVADPHGAVLIIFTPLPIGNPAPAPDMSEGTPGFPGWNELYAVDCKEAFDFYAKVFGWTIDHDMDMGEMGIYRIFAHNGKPIGGMMTKTENIPGPCWSYYFYAESIDAATDRVTSTGGTVLNGPMPVPGDMWIVNCIDPQGAHFSLVAPRV